MKKILLIEDDKHVLGLWADYFKTYARSDMFILVMATSLQDAEKEFKENQDVKAIVIDGRIIGSDGHAPSALQPPNTLNLVREFRKTFSGPMIAVSGSEDTQEELINAGCDEACYKHDAALRVMDLLGVRKKETA
jgi:CheY-like chemotaxis protein